MIDTRRTVRCLLIPLGGEPSLLPSTAVAEVVPYKPVERPRGSPEWFLGWLDWRGIQVPMVSLEQAWRQPEPADGANTHVAVLNTLNGTPELPFIAIRTQGIPRLLQVDKTGATPRRPPHALPLTLLSVQVNDTPAVIPDLDGLERMVLPLVNKRGAGDVADQPRSLGGAG